MAPIIARLAAELITQLPEDIGPHMDLELSKA